LSTRWNPPQVSEVEILKPAWFETPPSQLRARLATLDTETIKYCYDLYHAPNKTPKSETGRYNLIIERFRARSVYPPGLSNIDFVKEYIALLLYTLPDSYSPRCELIETLLKEEFEVTIFERLISLPGSEVSKQKK
jgi:hypothetical protein